MVLPIPKPKNLDKKRRTRRKALTVLCQIATEHLITFYVCRNDKKIRSLVDHWELKFRRKGFSMAPVLSRSLTTASLASLPSSSLFLLRNSNRNRVLNLTTAFVPQNGLKERFSSSGLKWKYERRNHRFALQCEAAAVAEKEAADTSDEKFEYQAETIKKLEIAIVASLLGLRPKVDGERLIAVIPPLTKEHIQAVCKVVTNSCEDARQSIIRARQKAMDTAKKLYSHAPKDDVKKLEKEVSSKLVGVNMQ